MNVKRMLSGLICLSLLLCCLPALGAGVSDVMQVVNCSEWVSLREDPSTSSQRLAKVYLGELVTNCVSAWDGFIQCDYNGKTGYILSKYLKTTSFTLADDVLRNQMVVNTEAYADFLASPRSSGRVIAQVPIGTVVTSCVVQGSYVSCVYDRTRGYIHKNYLHTANYSVTSQDASVVKKYQGLFPAIYGPMNVVNCNEWVSLRERASTSAARLARVPLGAQVTDCLQVSETFIYCCYRGVWGYVQTAYLAQGQSQPLPSESGFDSLPQRPTYDEFNGVGEWVTEFWSDPLHTYRTVVRRDNTGLTETVCAAVYNSDIEYIGQVSMTADDPTELPTMSVFAGGTEEKRVLMWYTGDGLSAFEIGPVMGDNQLWHLPLPGVGAGVTQAVDADGTVYLIGYYQCLLTCVSPDGQLLWQKQLEDPEIYWPRTIEIDGDLLNVIFEGSEFRDGSETLVSFDKLTGERLESAAPQPVESLFDLVWNEAGSKPYYLFAADTSEDAAGVLMTPKERVTDFTFLALSLDITPEGEERYTAQPVFTQAELTPETPLLVMTLFVGDMPNNGFVCTDSSGRQRYFALNIGGESGEPVCWEINPPEMTEAV